MLDVETLARAVWQELGPGYTESIYHNALEVLLRQQGIPYETERIIPVYFQDHVIGNLRADIILKDCIIELKSVKSLTDPNRTQIKLYMKLLNVHNGILVNFGCDHLQVEKFTLSEYTPT
jgi:GxxExxY protein